MEQGHLPSWDKVEVLKWSMTGATLSIDLVVFLILEFFLHPVKIMIFTYSFQIVKSS